MNISVQVFDPDRIATDAQLFCGEIDRDPWVIFHGTSGFNADAIEREGFRPRLNMISREELQRVVNVYEAMKWAGENGGGLAILKPFSLDHDLRDPKASLLFFAETSLRALLYATRDFSGGEKLRALRIAFADLDSYLQEPAVRERHEAQMLTNCRALIRINAHPSMIETARPVKVDFDWLREQMDALANIRQLADDARRRHDHGIIYAVKHTGDSAPPLAKSHHHHQSTSGSANPGARTGRQRKLCHTTGPPTPLASDSPLWCSPCLSSKSAKNAPRRATACDQMYAHSHQNQCLSGCRLLVRR